MFPTGSVEKLVGSAWAETLPSMVTHVRVLYKYNAQHQNEPSFEKDDIITAFETSYGAVTTW